MRLRFGYRKEVWAWGLHEDLYREYKERRVGRRGRVGGGGGRIHYKVYLEQGIMYTGFYQELYNV